jgi:asparagine synthase (glutamine-hydrolysing)
MCGLAGWIGDACPPGVLAMRATLAHRGPDDEGALAWWRDGRAAAPRSDDEAAGAAAVLLFRRLSIIDTSSAGHQPMRSGDGRWWLAFNGEIYNHRELRAELEREGARFRSESDTEVALEAIARWGEAALSRFVGMFAIAALDTRSRSLLLARDPLGIKPLYYARWRGGLAFASEIKALLALPGMPRRADAQGLTDYLAEGLTDHRDGTCFAGIAPLPAGSRWRLELDRPHAGGPERFWTLTARSRAIGARDATEELRATLLASVRSHLIADVPVGCALSGGIDSSIIVGATRAALGRSARIDAVSYCAGDPGIDEERWMRAAAARARATVREVRVSASELAADLDDLVRTQDEPFGSTSIYAQFRVYRAAREAGLPVMVDGQGADELFAGYLPMLSQRLATLLRRGEFSRALAFAHAAARERELSPWGLAARAAALAFTPVSRRPRSRQAWIRWDELRDRGGAPTPWPIARGSDVLRERLRDATTRSSLPMLLRYADRNAMRWSVENRVPFVTPAVAELAQSLPEQLLVDERGTTKAVLRAAGRGLAPDEILDRRDKIGFATPEKRWLGELRPWIERTLAEADPARSPWLDLERFRVACAETLDGRSPFGFHLWRGLNLLRWQALLDVAP